MRLQAELRGSYAPEVAVGQLGLLSALLPAFGALGIWVASLRRIDPSTMSDLGLASVLPYAAWLPHLLLSVGFFFVIGRQPRQGWLPYLYLVALALVLHATPAIDYGTLRYPWVWKHLGIIDYIQRHGAVDRTTPILSAYHNWPGFFAAAALVADLAGVRDLAAPARWAPLASNLLYLAVLPMLYRSLTDDARVIFGGTWIFLCGNWVGQDYFSPQALALLFYLVLLALCLRFLAPPPLLAGAQTSRLLSSMAAAAQWTQRDGPSPAGQPNGASRVVITGAALLLIAAMTVTHQFTPLVAISALGVLAIFQRAAVGLFLFAAALTAIWILYVAAPFVAVVLPAEMKDLGATVLQLSSQLADMSVVSRGQALISLICRGLTLTIAVAALIGGMRRLGCGYRDGLAAALAVAAVPLLAVTSYGGEVIFRVYLFALPFLAFFAAALFFPSPRRGISADTLAGAALFGVVLAVAFVFANNGKDRQYAFTPEEVAAMQWLYDTAPPGTLIIEGAHVDPSQFRNVEYFTQVSLADEPPESRADVLAHPVPVLARWLDNDEYRAAFIVLTRNQKAYVEALGIMPRDGLDGIEQALLASPRFRLVHAAGGTKIFALNQAVRGMGDWVK
jgi:hypothetical protein